MCMHRAWGGRGVMPGVREVGQESAAHMGDASTDREAMTVEKDRGGTILRDLKEKELLELRLKTL